MLGNLVDSITASLNSADIYDKKLTNAYALDELARINPEDLNTTEQAALAIAKYYYAPKEVGDWTAWTRFWTLWTEDPLWTKQTAISMQGTEATSWILINMLKWGGLNGQLAALQLPVPVDQAITVITNSLLVSATAITTVVKADALPKNWAMQTIAAQYNTQESQHENIRLDEVNSIVYRAQPSVLLNTIDALLTLARVPALGYPTAEIVYKLARSFQATPQGGDIPFPYAQFAFRTTYLVSFGWVLATFLPLQKWLYSDTPSTEEKQWALNTLIDGLKIDFHNSNALCKDTPSKCDIETVFGPTVECLKAFKMPTDVIENIAKAPRTPYAKDILTRHLNLT